MTREELIHFMIWWDKRYCPPRLQYHREKDADAYLAEHLLPPAEGAEEILEGQLEILQEAGFKIPLKHGTIYNRIIDAMHEFATLHAQRIAEKMVEERMEQYKAQFKDRPNPLEVNPYDSKGIKRIRNRKIH